MKIFIKLICFVLVLGLVGPFVLRAPNGEPYWDYRAFVPTWSGVQSRMKRWWNNNGAEPSEDGNVQMMEESGDTNVNGWGNTQIYRWQDEDGVWRYSDSPPSDIEAETLLFNPNENVVPGAPSELVPEIADEQETDAREPGFGLPLPLTVAPGEVPQLIEDARQAREVMQQRNEKLESINGEPRQ